MNRKTSVYTLTVPQASEQLFQEMVSLVNILPHTTLADRVMRENGEGVVRFRCQTDDLLAAGTARTLMGNGADWLPGAVLTTGLGVNKRVVHQSPTPVNN